MKHPIHLKLSKNVNVLWKIMCIDFFVHGRNIGILKIECKELHKIISTHKRLKETVVSEIYYVYTKCNEISMHFWVTCDFVKIMAFTK